MGLLRRRGSRKFHGRSASHLVKETHSTCVLHPSRLGWNLCARVEDAKKREKEHVQVQTHRLPVVDQKKRNVVGQFDLPLYLSRLITASIQPTLCVGLGASLHQPDRVLGEGLELLAEVHFGCCFFLFFCFSVFFFE